LRAVAGLISQCIPAQEAKKRDPKAMLIAVDGPTASGKGTLAKRIAAHYGLALLDTGALYRAVGLALLDAGADPNDESEAEAAAKALDLAKVSDDRLRSSAAGTAASMVASMPKVRAALIQLQRDFAAQPGGAVLDGRDIGTVICPNADVKLYVDAALEVRTQRRLNELLGRGESIGFDELKAQIAARDARDMSRAEAPLRRAEDARLLDTTALSIEGAAEAAFSLIEAVRARPSA
jgi:cytidylate kinase